MKKNLLLMMGAAMMLAIGISSCSSDNDTSENSDISNIESPSMLSSLLYNTWVLVSYGDESNEVLKEEKGYYYQITFRPDGTYSGKAYGNDMWGEFSLMASGIKISHPEITKVDWEGSDPDKFFLQHLSDVSTYSITDMELRLYYSKDQYFKFRTKNDL